METAHHDTIDNLKSMLNNASYNLDVYLNGMEALNNRYNMKHEKEWNGLRKMLIKYNRDRGGNKILAKEILNELDYLIDN